MALSMPDNPSTTLSQRIKTQALALGFDLVGIAPAQGSPELQFFEQWLAQGHAGEMHYLARNLERRIDLQQVLPGARSVIVCGLNYDTDIPYSTASHAPDRGWVARYAWGYDYHTVMQEKLRGLQQFVATLVPADVASKLYVDTGPVVERVYAKYAGLGWFGKNTCMLNRHFGSWLLLGELIVTMPLDYDRPVADHCGTCTRCLDACPTEALIAPYVLDARRCISYLTIELKGAIPEALRPQLGAHVFGCDICQDVCPWNRQRHFTEEPGLQPRPQQVLPRLAELALMSQEDFKRAFRDTPLERSKRRGLLRNVCVAMGNSGQTAFIPLLETLAQDEEELVREHAAWALARLRPPLEPPAASLV